MRQIEFGGPSMAETRETVTPESPQKEQGKRGRKAGAIIFPRDPLKEVLAIPEAIWKQNAGNPMPILDLASTINQSPNSSGFVRQLSSSYRYGLTEGSPATKVISLTSLGRAIIAPTADTNVSESSKAALMHSEIFRKVYSTFDDKPIPRTEILRNTLVNPPEASGFGILRSDVDEFIKIWMQNITDYGLAHDIKGTTYLRLNKLGVSQLVVPEISSEQITSEEIMEPEVQPTKVEEKQIPKQIFVAHGKNTKPLEQLEKILNRFKVNYKVAVEEANSGRPVSTKVAELMKNCTSGIFIFTADEKTQDADGNEIWRPSDNVVYELGAASVLYGNKIVIFKESDVKFASDFSDLGYIPFEKDKLDAKSADLMLELINLGFMQLTPT